MTASVQHTLIATVKDGSSPVDVAVAVICYEQKYLLAYRNKQQHQGDQFEFVGGKIEPAERAEGALIREVQEELGMVLTAEQLTHMGNIRHDYGDKAVCLYVFKVQLHEAQYVQFAKVTHGQEQQPLMWVDKSALVAGQYPLPKANLQILDWLKTPAGSIKK